jgi:hypothetical protein
VLQRDAVTEIQLAGRSSEANGASITDSLSKNNDPLPFILPNRARTVKSVLGKGSGCYVFEK